MSEKKIEQVIEVIMSEAEAEAEKIISDAKAKAEEIVKKARRQLEQSIKQQVDKVFSTVIKGEIRRKIAEAKLEAKKIISNAKEEAIREVLNATIKKLKDFTKTEEYKKVLEKLICEAGETLGGGELIVELSKKDKDVLLNWEEISRKIEESTGSKTIIKEVNANLDCIGGAIVKSADGRFMFNNTFEERINQIERKLRVMIAKKLFR